MPRIWYVPSPVATVVNPGHSQTDPLTKFDPPPAPPGGHPTGIAALPNRGGVSHFAGPKPRRGGAAVEQEIETLGVLLDQVIGFVVVITPSNFGIAISP